VSSISGWACILIGRPTLPPSHLYTFRFQILPHSQTGLSSPSLEEINKFPVTCNLSRLYNKKIENLYRPIMSKESE
jgi:hypothetical protein